jgi:capsular exopolysaccharide synthesis family protein
MQQQTPMQYMPPPNYSPHRMATLRDYAKIFLARRWTIFIIFLMGIGATFYYLHRAIPVYQTQATLMREVTDQVSMTNIGIPYAFRQSIEGHIELLKSNASVDRIREKLMNEYNLEYTAVEIVREVSLQLPSADVSNRWVSNPILKLTARANTPERAMALANAAAEVYIQQMSDFKKSDLDKGVDFLSHQMDLVEQNLRAAEQELNDFREREGFFALPKQDSKATTGLLGRLEDMYDELARTEGELDLSKSQLASIKSLIEEKRQGSLLSLIESMPPKIEQIQEQLSIRKLELETLQSQMTDKAPEVQRAQRDIEVLEKRLKEEVAAQFGGDQIAPLDPLSELQGLMQQYVSLDMKVRELEMKGGILQKRISTFREDHPELISQQVEFTRLERKARVHEQTYLNLLSRYEELRLLKEMKASGLRIIDKAQLPLFPISPQKNRIRLFGIALGLMLGVGVAFLLEYMDDSIRLKEDVTPELGMPVLGTIPKIKSLPIPESALDARQSSESHEESHALTSLPVAIPVDSLSGSGVHDPSGSDQLNGNSIDDATNSRSAYRGRRKHRRGHRKRMKQLLSSIIMYAGQSSPVVTNYRTTVANIRYANLDQPMQTILITSSMPSEGKTSTATNIAISFAATGSKVLLIDADLRRPRIHRIFQFDRAPGLTDLLTEEQHDALASPTEVFIELENHLINSYIRATTVDNLWLLSCGRHISNPESLLTSEKMKQFIQNVKSQYDMIIIDSPPLLSVSDSLIMATLVDGTLMVLRSNKVKHNTVFQAKELLDKVNASVIGSVLNDVNYARYYGYYYYYYHYYRSYYDYQSDRDEE